MKKLIFGLTAIVIVITGIFTFAGCEKEETMDEPKNLSLAFMRVDFFDYLGQTYSVADFPELFELAGGNFWYYDADGTKHWYYPYNGNPYFRPPYDPDDSRSNYRIY